MWLDSEVFRTVVSSTPLVSIDLLVQNSQGKLLLGQRLNRPAQGFWFVPGGRILKNESLSEAFLRLTESELGIPVPRHQASLLGVYEHLYPDSFFGSSNNDPDTHYIVLGYLLRLCENQSVTLSTDQHAQYEWWATEDICNNTEVHENTRAYLDALS